MVYAFFQLNKEMRLISLNLLAIYRHNIVSIKKVDLTFFYFLPFGDFNARYIDEKTVIFQFSRSSKGASSL